MKNAIYKLPTWLLALGFFTIVAAAYMLLNHFLGFSNEAWLFR